MTMILKNKQYYYWNKKTVTPWVKYDIEMDNKFSYINKILFDSINIKKNQTILDIGCGSGFTSYHLSKKVSDHGNIIGVDISKPLLSLFKKKYKNIKNLKSIRKDLQQSKLENNKFDHAISRFGVMFFEYPSIAFKHIYQSLRKNASLTFVCWAGFRYNQFFTIPTYSVSENIDVSIPKISNKPGPFAFKDKIFVKKLLKQSGFKKITIKNIRTKLKINSITADVDIMMNLGIGAQMIRENNINKKTYDIIKEDIRNKLRKIYKEQNYYNASIYLVAAYK